MSAKVDNITALVEPVIQAMGYELWGVGLHQSGRHSLLRIYVEVPPGIKQQGVAIDDCSKISSQVSALLDVENPISGSYMLEVSSPGLDRHLYKLEHYQRYIGNLIKVRLLQPLDGYRNLQGKINKVLDGEIELLVNDKVVTLALTNIEKANLIPTF